MTYHKFKKSEIYTGEVNDYFIFEGSTELEEATINYLNQSIFFN